FRLRALVEGGLLDSESFPSGWHTKIVTLEEAGAKVLAAASRDTGAPPPHICPPPRLDQAGHHLLTVQTALLVLYRTTGRVIRFLGDESLRSESRRGQRSRRGRSTEQLPDGRLEFVADG